MLRRGGVSAVCVLAACCALVGCDAIFGIDVFPDGPGGDGGGSDSSVTSEGGPDSSADGGTSDVIGSDGPGGDVVNASDGSHDAGSSPDAPDDAPKSGCPPECNGTDTRCVGPLLQSCENVNGCFKWGTPAACPGGGSCWGAGFNAYCCTGGADVCAPSCRGLIPDAGRGSGCGTAPFDESCCTSLVVDGGTFFRSYDGITDTDKTSPATVSTFALDKYEVTVNRFRNFVTAWVNGFRPAAGSGIHAYLNSGMGLTDSSPSGYTYEQGWNDAWTSTSLNQQIDWEQWLKCDGSRSAWTTQPGGNETLPINCVDWASAYAFCIWDDGFLPSEAEWNYAAAGGGDAQGQRVYAWSIPPNPETIDCSYASYKPCATAITPAGLYPNGYGRWGHADLTGNVWEWNLDSYASYITPCTDCAYMMDISSRSIRGASYDYPANELYVAARVGDDPTSRFSNSGFRCARAP